MKKITTLFFIALALIIMQGCSLQNNFKSSKIETRADSASYMLGLSIGHSLQKDDVPDIKSDLIAKGIEEVLEGDTTGPNMQEIQNFLNTYFMELRDAKTAKAQEESAEFLTENKNKEGIKETASGLQYKVLEEGTGKSPNANDVVKCHYVGKLLSGEEFDNSYKRGQPAEFNLSGVIPGWTEGLQLMKEGGKYKLWIPSHLGYGERGAGAQIPPNSTLVFEIELLEVVESEGETVAEPEEKTAE